MICLDKLTDEAEASLRPVFEEIDRISFITTKHVMDAFCEMRVSESYFAPSSGYGYDDRGRDMLDKIYAKAFGCESAVVRPHIVSGTHALTIGLFGLLRPGDTLLSVTGKPYDTLDSVIGLTGEGMGSLRDYGIEYVQLELDCDMKEELKKQPKVVFIQRSKGYMNRRTLTVSEINNIIKIIRNLSPESYVVVDNCYGEFTEEHEPQADLLIGSLIKNPGGGLAESGGYLAGSAKAVELASYRLTSPGIGAEVGASLGQMKLMYRGFFNAPHTVAQAKKTAHFAAYLFDKLGYDVEPNWNSPRSDIIQAVKFGKAELLEAFCRGIQAGSPVDAYVTPLSWDMPGYTDKVIMAAGTFVQGASIELSADGPMKPPYTAFFQGGLTYESGKLGILSAVQAVLETK